MCMCRSRRASPCSRASLGTAPRSGSSTAPACSRASRASSTASLPMPVRSGLPRLFNQLCGHSPQVPLVWKLKTSICCSRPCERSTRRVSAAAHGHWQGLLAHMFVVMLCDVCDRLWQVDFTPKCRSQLMKQQKRRLGDWRLDFNLRTSCEADVEKHCRVRPPHLTPTQKALCWTSASSHCRSPTSTL